LIKEIHLLGSLTLEYYLELTMGNFDEHDEIEAKAIQEEQRSNDDGD